MYKNISAQMSEEDKNTIIQKLQEVEALLPFIVNLSPNERKAIPNMGRKSLKFVESAIGYAQKHPTFVPPFLDVAEQHRDFNLTKQLYDIIEVLNPLCEKINDTCFAVGAEAFASARVFYSTLKAAEKAGTPGVDTIVKDLGQTFKKSAPANREKEGG